MVIKSIFVMFGIALTFLAALMLIEHHEDLEYKYQRYANGVVDVDAKVWFSQKLFADDLIMTRDPLVSADSRRVRYRLETVGQVLYGACFVKEYSSVQVCQIIEELSQPEL